MVLRSALKLLQNSDRSSENGITIPDFVKNRNVFPATINMPDLLMCSIALIFSGDSFWDKVPAAPMPLNHTNDTYSMFNRYPQPTNQQPRICGVLFNAKYGQ